MEIALINPRTNVFEMRMLYDIHENLALGLISSCLKENGYKTQIFDLRVDRKTEKEVAKQISLSNINIVGLSVNYVTFPSAIAIAQEIKLLNSNIIIILGGEHVSYQEKLLKYYNEFIDYIVRGESEFTFLELVNAITLKKDVSSIQGITFHEDNEIKRTSNRLPISNLDTLPFADRGVAQKALSLDNGLEIGMLAQRGCPFQCSFCNANRFLSNETKMTVRFRSPDNVV